MVALTQIGCQCIMLGFLMEGHSVRVWSIHANGEAPQTVHPNVKPCLLLSNCCHVFVIETRTLIWLSPKSLLAKLQVLVVVCEGDLHSGVTYTWD